MNLYEFEAIWSTKRVPAIFSEILFQAKQNKNDINQDIIKSNFKIGENTATEHIGRHCSPIRRAPSVF